MHVIKLALTIKYFLKKSLFYFIADKDYFLIVVQNPTEWNPLKMTFSSLYLNVFLFNVQKAVSK